MVTMRLAINLQVQAPTKRGGPCYPQCRQDRREAPALPEQPALGVRGWCPVQLLLFQGQGGPDGGTGNAGGVLNLGGASTATCGVILPHDG
jgi:hypothetical protein